MLSLLAALLLPAAPLAELPSAAQAQKADTIRVATARLTPVRVRVARERYQGRDAVKIDEIRQVGDTVNQLLPSYAILDHTFSQGTIEFDVASRVRAGSDTAASRGFVGLAFHVADGQPETYRAFYLRPLNSRAREQLRRNRSAQYIAHPDFPWQRLRREEPGAFESYVDLEPGAWTRVRIEVTATTATLFVNGVRQPTLAVTDLKTGRGTGRLALWIDAGTEAWFSDLVVTPAAPGR